MVELPLPEIGLHETVEPNQAPMFLSTTTTTSLADIAGAVITWRNTVKLRAARDVDCLLAECPGSYHQV